MLPDNASPLNSCACARKPYLNARRLSCGFRANTFSDFEKSPARIPMKLRVVAAMRIHFTGLALASALARAAIAQSPTQLTASKTPAGTWRGTSACLVRPSACNDENVVYRITPLKAADSLAIDGRRIVRGEEQEMGVLGCRLLPASGQFICTIPQ